MIIKWYGETSFLLQDSTGRRILIDPFELESHENIISLNPSIITLSRTTPNLHIDASLNDSCEIIQDIGMFEFDFLLVNGYKSFHDNFNGQKRGENKIFVYSLDNLKICHLGHLGHLLSKNFIENLGEIDILLIPVGGHFTLDGLMASNICEKINPNFIIPMYYKTESSLKFLDSSKEFIINMKNAIKMPKNYIDTSNLIQEKKCTVLLLKENLNV